MLPHKIWPFIYVLSVGLVIVIVCFSANAQTLLQLGELSYSRASAPHLRKAVSITPGFFRAVGGVAFRSVAKGRDGYIVTSIVYVSENKDGQRLRVTIKRPGEEYRIFNMEIYDWQLVPIANFSKSNEGSAMTLFGTLEDGDFANEVMQKKGRIINYHETLDNTLLGLRLMQADIMLFDQNAVDLPKQGGSYVLGAGESVPDLEQNMSAFNAVATYMDNKQYRSYVVGDLDAQVEFGVVGDRFTFFGQPTWTRGAVELLRLVEQARGESLDSYKALTRLSELYDSVEKLEIAVNRSVLVLESYDFTNIANWEVELDEELGRSISEIVRKENGINPAVYQTVENVMYYRALFKHYKEVSPLGYEKFVNSLSGVAVLPRVVTPTVQRNERLH